MLIAAVQSLQIVIADWSWFSGVELLEELKHWNFAAHLEQQKVKIEKIRKSKEN